MFPGCDQHGLSVGPQHCGLLSAQKTSETFNVFTQAMVDIHYKFHLQDKMTRTMTDNGKIFVKTFMQFDTDVELLLDIPGDAADPDIESIKDVDLDLDLDPNAGDVDKVENISINVILDESRGMGLKLPVHSSYLQLCSPCKCQKGS